MIALLGLRQTLDAFAACNDGAPGARQPIRSTGRPNR